MNPNTRIIRPISGFLAMCYAAVMVPSHDWAQQFVIGVQKDPSWTWPALGAMVTILFSLSVIFVRRWQRHATPERNRDLLLLWLTTAGLIGSAQWLLVSVHTEAIHYLQYGLFTVLVFLALRRIRAVFIFVIVVGMLDEAYQYWFLYPGWPVYYDVNDVILNTLAGGLALLFLLSAFPEAFRDSDKDSWLTRNADLAVIGALVCFLVAGIASGAIALYRFPEEVSKGALLILNRNAASDRFWSHAWWSGRFYHQLSFVNGMLIVLLIAGFYRHFLPMLLVKPRP